MCSNTLATVPWCAEGRIPNDVSPKVPAGPNVLILAHEIELGVYNRVVSAASPSLPRHTCVCVCVLPAQRDLHKESSGSKKKILGTLKIPEFLKC